jgi:hypothetical protein
MVTKRGMAGAAGSVVELTSFLEKKLSSKSAEYAAVSNIFRLIAFSV